MVTILREKMICPREWSTLVKDAKCNTHNNTNSCTVIIIINIATCEGVSNHANAKTKRSTSVLVGPSLYTHDSTMFTSRITPRAFQAMADRAQRCVAAQGQHVEGRH